MASNKIGLEVNANIYNYMIMSRNQNEGRDHSMKIDNRSFEMVADFQFWGKNLRI